MKVARLYSFNDIRIEDIPVPRVGPGDILIKTAGCGICSGDVMPWYIERKAPLVLGHEPVGEIVDMGGEIEAEGFPLARGDRVFVHHHAPCLRCDCCARGDYVQCDTWRKTHIIPGGIAEFILIPGINARHDTLKLPPSVSYEDGILVEPTACVVKALRRAGIRKGATVLMIGLGVMGQMHVLLAREFGASAVMGADLVPFRLGKAMQFGADAVIDVAAADLIEDVGRLTDGKMADIVVVGPNSVQAMAQGIRAVSRGGTVLLFTPARPGEMLTIDPNELYFKDINIVTSYSCGPDDTRAALAFIDRGVVNAERLVTHRFPVEETAEAFRLTAEAKDSLKCVILF